jgi:glutamine amidotransferase
VKKQVAIINCIGSNLASLKFALDRININFIVTNEVSQIRNSSHVILPGVGVAKNAMNKLSQQEIIEAVIDLSQPTLGICLGMQLFMEYSEENDTSCLGIVNDGCKLFKIEEDYPVPHMGWNKIELESPSNLTTGINNETHFYFVHSYYVPLCSETIASTTYSEKFSAIIQKDNFIGTQFHPEKSGEQGSIILRNFTDL